jgi:hypothetical protein
MVTKTANYDLSARNTFRMQVHCALYVEVTEEADLPALDWDSLPQPVLVMGGGSNLLFTRDFPGTVLHVAADTTAFGGTPFASLSPAPPTADAAGPSRSRSHGRLRSAESGGTAAAPRITSGELALNDSFGKVLPLSIVVRLEK